MDIDIDFSDLRADDDELINEIEKRGYRVFSIEQQESSDLIKESLQNDLAGIEKTLNEALRMYPNQIIADHLCQLVNTRRKEWNLTPLNAPTLWDL